MGNKKKQKFGLKVRPPAPTDYQPVNHKRKGRSAGTKLLIGLAFVVIIVVSSSIAISMLSTPNGQQQAGSYPQNAAPVFYASRSLSSNDAKVTVPSTYVKSNKLVFVDLKLETPTETLPYQGRTVPLAYYKNGDYLPLVLISTPSGKTVAGIRTCEPCGSFSFHIVKGTNLKCDVCGAEWNLEDFAPSSGGCATYPPPKLSATDDGENVEIDLSALPVQMAA